MSRIDRPPGDLDVRQRLVNLLARCHGDPGLFNDAILGRPPMWAKQREIAESVVNYRITCVVSGNATGKDWLTGGCIIPWWLSTRHESQVIATGPSQTSLGAVLWKNVRQAVANSRIPLGIEVSQGITASPLRAVVRGDWGAMAISTTSIERASGHHNRRLLVIADEASGISDEIFDALDSLNYFRLLLVGNPVRSSGRFIDIYRQGEKDRRDGVPPGRAVNAIHISSRESPDAHLAVSQRGLASRGWIEDIERRYGRNSLYVRSHIDAIIPDNDSESLIPIEWLDWAASRPPLPAVPLNHPSVARRRIACDLGEGVGRDSSAIVVRDDRGILEVVFGNTLGLAEAATEIARLAQKWSVKHERISFDCLGIGRDMPLHLARNRIKTAAPYAGSGKPRSSQFPNLRSEAFWRLRQRLDPDGANDHRDPHKARPDFVIPAGPFWPRMRNELKELTYDLAGGKTRVMPKDDWAKVLGHSPDLADCLAQSMGFD